MNDASFKKELVHDEDYATREEARASLFEYIEVFYNRVRRHSSLGYRVPGRVRASRKTVNSARHSWGSPPPSSPDLTGPSPAMPSRPGAADRPSTTTPDGSSSGCDRRPRLGPGRSAHVNPPPAASLDEPTRRRLAVTAFAMGISTRQIEDLFRVILPDDAPDHSTIGRWVTDEAKKAKPVLEVLDAASAPRVRTLALDKIFSVSATLAGYRSPPRKSVTNRTFYGRQREPVDRVPRLVVGIPRRDAQRRGHLQHQRRAPSGGRGASWSRRTQTDASPL